MPITIRYWGNQKSLHTDHHAGSQKRKRSPNVGKGWQKPDLLCPDEGMNIKYCSHSENQAGNSQEHQTSNCCESQLCFWTFSRGNNNLHLNRKLYLNVDASPNPPMYELPMRNRCHSTEEWCNKLWYVHETEYYSAAIRSQLLMHDDEESL